MTPHLVNYVHVQQFVQIKDELHWSDLILVATFLICKIALGYL